MDRRAFLLGTGAVLLPGVASGFVPASSPMGLAGDLANPTVLRSVDGALDVDLTAAMGDVILPQGPAHLRLYGGGMPGTTWAVRPGDTLRVRLRNDLPPNQDDNAGHSHVRPGKLNTTNLHVHGLHVSPRAPADDVFLQIEPGQSFDYVYAIPETHPVGTYWYHPHRHGSVAVQVSSGMAGMIVMEDPDGPPDMVERHLVIQAPMVGPDGALNDPMVFLHLHDETHFIINGQYRPRIHLRAGETQFWRVALANANQFLPLDFAAIPGLEVAVVGRDGNPLPAPLPVERVELTPGNRLDLLVTAHTPGVHALNRPAFDQGVMGVPSVPLADLVVLPGGGAPTVAPVGAGNGPPEPVRADEIVARRRFTLGQKMDPEAVFNTVFTIDGRPYDPELFVTAKLGTAEEWEFVNLTNVPHPIHIHVNPFQVVEIDGVPVPDRPWLDTVAVPAAGTVKLWMRFADFDGDFVMHCHILPHEDAGMMMNVRIEA